MVALEDFGPAFPQIIELALDAVSRGRFERVVVIGGGGGRLDHLFGNVLLLAAEKYKHMRVEADLGLARVAVAHGGAGEVVLDGAPGDLVTLLPVGTATGIVTAFAPSAPGARLTST